MEPSTRRRGVIKREQVQLDEPARAAPPTPKAPAGRAPRVRLLELDEHRQALELTCSCGEVSLIEIETEKKT
jgi:hypothetical protein